MGFFCSNHGTSEGIVCPGCVEASRRKSLDLKPCPVAVVSRYVPEVIEDSEGSDDEWPWPLDLMEDEVLPPRTSPMASLEAAISMIAVSAANRGDGSGSVGELRRSHLPSISSGVAGPVYPFLLGRGRGLPVVPRYPLGRGMSVRPPPELSNLGGVRTRFFRPQAVPRVPAEVEDRLSVENRYADGKCASFRPFEFLSQ